MIAPTSVMMRASRLRRTPLTPTSGDTTYPVPSIQVTAQEQDMNAPPKIDPVTGHSGQAGVASYPDPPSAVAWRPDDVGGRDARGRDCESRLRCQGAIRIHR